MWDQMQEIIHGQVSKGHVCYGMFFSSPKEGHRPASKGHVTSVNLLECPSKRPILNTKPHERKITDVTFDHVKVCPHVQFLGWLADNLK